MVSEQQLKTITEYVEEARKEGAEVYQAPCHIPKKGFYYPPTLITNVQTTSRVVQEEVCLRACSFCRFMIIFINVKYLRSIFMTFLQFSI